MPPPAETPYFCLMKDVQLPTIKEIAKQLNVSVSTVSRALHDHPGIGRMMSLDECIWCK